ncbi:hypothetical protein [Stratiformator vulcanicus]|uniref:Uncharacterized protein n=1 Tax=Stratiformator vulcanicus TaxID=2527980 RepID=A0A517R4T6_9PLAN|nr:hypothetical protein [Stratiformator vulcanicus]QDT38891.1 hypothetical protein Pan189_32900 [Stratiformator vulcanicus]
MSFVILTAGVAILYFTIYDAVITVLSTQGAGPLTRLWTGAVWYCGLAFTVVGQSTSC